MSKEQLETGFVIETAKREVVIAKGINNTRDYVNLPIDLVLVLIEQAERVQEYDKELISLEDNKHYVSEILAKNKRYREALEFYADGENYDEEMIGSTLISGSKVMYDEGQIAREVLEERSDR